MYGFETYDCDAVAEPEVAMNLPRASSPHYGSGTQYGTRTQASRVRARKRRRSTQFNGLHRRRSHRWSW